MPWSHSCHSWPSFLNSKVSPDELTYSTTSNSKPLQKSLFSASSTRKSIGISKDALYNLPISRPRPRLVSAKARLPLTSLSSPSFSPSRSIGLRLKKCSRGLLDVQSATHDGSVSCEYFSGFVQCPRMSRLRCFSMKLRAERV